MNLIKKTSSLGRIVAGIVLVLFGGIYGLSGLVDIDPGEVGLQIKKIGTGRGISADTMATGLHWVEPFTYDVAVYDTRLKQYDLRNVPATTKDGQPIQVDMSLEMGLVDKNVPALHQNIGRDYYDQVVYPATRATLRNTTTLHQSDDIYTGAGRAAIQAAVQRILREKVETLGMRLSVNLRDIVFQNHDFVATLEEKAKAQQRVEIENRNAMAAVHTAEKMRNLAEGEKQKRIKAAEADKEEIRLKGLGQRLGKEQEAKGNLALARAAAEGTRLQVLAYGSGQTYASVKWAENLAPKLKVWGVPTGAPGTSSLMDINGVLKGAFAPQQPKGE